MTTQNLTIRHEFGGGWATDFGPTVYSAPGRNGEFTMPFLRIADNVQFELNGGIRKVAGTARVNSSAVGGGAAVKGVFDAWLHGTVGSPAQHRIIHVSTLIMRDDADGTFTNLFTGLETDKVPSYSMLTDLITMSSDSTADVPRSWDGSTAQNLAGSPPNFAFSVSHINHTFASGVVSNPSRVYYSDLLKPADWTGGVAGSVDIEPDDGDRVMALASHQNSLWVFKGPYKGSIHRLTGATISGLARTQYARGIGAGGPNLIFPMGADLGFVNFDGTIHSLAQTQAFGDFSEAALSRPINQYLKDHVNRGRIDHGYAANLNDEGRVYIALPVDSSSDPNVIILMDYRFPSPRFSKLPVFNTAAVSLATGINASDNNKVVIYGGGSDGFVRTLGDPDRSIDAATAISLHVATPFMSYGHTMQLKDLQGVALGFQPKNDGNVTFGWTRDNNAEQTVTISQGGADVLGTADANQFTLGTSTLGGALYIDRFSRLAEEGGIFRSISFSIKNTVINEDAEIHSITAHGSVRSISFEQDPA